MAEKQNCLWHRYRMKLCQIFKDTNLLKVVFFGALAMPVAVASTDVEDIRPTLTVIHAGKLLAVPGREVLDEQTVIVKGNKVERIVAGYVDPQAMKADHYVDLSASFVLPGLMDMHVHLTSGDDGKQTTADQTITGAVHAQKTLLAGITTVRNIGSDGIAIFALRDAINDSHKLPGPRIYAAGSALSATAGHADSTGYHAVVSKRDRSAGVCDSAAECRKKVREQIRLGADVIKLTATGGGGKPMGHKDSAPEFYADEIEAIVDMAHRHNKKVAAHAHGTAGINLALRLGVDSIEHGSYMDKQSFKLFKKNDTYLVPTLSVLEMLRDLVKRVSAERQRPIKAVLDVVPDNMARAHKAGVKFAMGTDAGVVTHGENMLELKLMVDLGMTPMQAIEAATVNSADLLGQSSQLGTLEPGKLADVIATKGNPLEDVSVLSDVRFVMRDGKIYKSD